MKFSHHLALLGLAVGMGTASTAWSAPFQDTPPAGSAGASTAPHAMPDPQKQTARLSRKLQLTPDQAAKIEPILANRLQQMQQLRGDTSSSKRDVHQKMRALKQDTDSQIQAILTDSQRQQYQQMQQQAMQKHLDHKQGAPAAGGGSQSNGG
jgi:Spy/CpxP family protein refolding chaperone